MNVFAVGRLLAKTSLLLLFSSSYVFVDSIDVFTGLGIIVIVVTVIITTSATTVSSTTTSSITSATAGIVIVDSISDTFHISSYLECSPVLLHLIEIEFLGFETYDFFPNKLDLFDFQFKVLKDL
ncbi:hypothetical protein PENSOL_c154G11065 [Penicillium solitum]|uniref:Uncharacterized protein n=1 Tax=Penicillium solitum TaxID=60172 RepID=A0A1V6Q2A2_9EURO|nr:uncharacterized protein PENSOL_c154G11065 [Penicillium solitum]OQD83418.1 hypothetical protein PENSOL_c154G11065 [Penicillium solitum]